ncbi:hypothetical protein AAVH_02528 [Aphelenchoides avenae]|nr:hypothetical protein AAVH_02528 [Aphelenchus avenae]
MFFKNQLLRPWDAAKSRKVFNYDLNCMYKLLEGQYNFSIQLNVERGTLRRKPMRFQNIRQPFNHLRWNFTKLKPDEILYLLRCLDKPYTDDVLDTHVLCVNASPLERGHSLVVPSVGKCLPQVLTETALRLATDLMLLVEDDNFHLLFNSLLGQASVNHLHLHTIFWPYESDLVYRRFDKLFEDVYVIRRPAWFIQAFAFQLQGPENFQSFLTRLTQCANFLTSENIAHNLFMTRAPPIRVEGDVRTEEGVKEQPQLVTAYLFPRQCHRVLLRSS